MFSHSPRTEDCDKLIKKLGELEQTYLLNL